MATNGDFSDESQPGSPILDGNNVQDFDDQEPLDKPSKSSMKKIEPLPQKPRPELPEQPEPSTLDLSTLTPLTPEIIARQATINIGTIGHVAHGKSTVVKALSTVQTVRFKNELERNITIKLGYANAKIYKCDNPACPRPTCYRSYGSEKEIDPPCEREGCGGRYRLKLHTSFVDCPGHDILMSTMVSRTTPRVSSQLYAFVSSSVLTFLYEIVVWRLVSTTDFICCDILCFCTNCSTPI